MRALLLAVSALAATALAPFPSPAASAERAGCSRAVATASVAWDRDLAPASQGVVVRIAYPPSVDVPVADGSRSPAARVENRTGAGGGLFDSVRKDGDGDGRPDLVNVGLIAASIPPGEFASVRFDCVAAAPPRATDFSCTAEVAGGRGPIPATCAVVLALE
jgi:hypothetical protein